MKLPKIFSALTMLLVMLMLTACHDENDKPEIIEAPAKLSEAIVGKWLLASSDAKEWTVYEFKQSQQMTSEWLVNNALLTGSGTYFMNDEKSSLTGTINDFRGNYINIDWIAKKIQSFQIDIDIYGGADGNQLLTSNALYKIVGSQEVEYGASIELDYRKFTGTNECSGFKSIDESIVTVNSSGKVECVGAGKTFVIFNTPGGHACIKISVSDKIMTFAETIIGTWVTDNKGYIWERDVYGEDGYFYAQWSREIIFPTTNESAQGTYTVDEANKTIKISAKTPYNQQLNVENRITQIDKYSFKTDVYSGGDKTGTFYYQKVLSSISIVPKEIEQPNYLGMVGSSQISGYSSHDEQIASVDKTTGVITGVSNGITYIDVITNDGTAVIEVEVSGGAIPYDFQDCIGQTASIVKEMLGTPDYEDDVTLIYNNITSTIDMVGVRLDSFSELVKGITVTYNSSVNTEDVTSILEATFIPYQKGTTETYKAYMDTAERADASVGVTWDIPALKLVYVNLAEDLFTDYSILIGMTRDEVIAKMEREPDISDEETQAFLISDNKGITFVAAYYTDFTQYFDRVHSVDAIFDDSLSEEEITNYLKKKYPYYPEYSTEEELAFIPIGQQMVVYYMPKEKQIIYISLVDTSEPNAKIQSIAKHLQMKTRSAR